MEKRIQDVEDLLATTRQELDALQQELFNVAVERREVKVKLEQLDLQIARCLRILDGVQRLTVQNPDSYAHVTVRLTTLTDQIHRLEEEVGDVKRTVFEHTIFLKNLRRDVEQIKNDVADLKTGQTQILEAIRNLQR